MLYDFDAGQLVTTHVYGSYHEAKAHAEQLDDVLILRLPIATAGSNAGEADEKAEALCDCEQPGAFCCGVPGILYGLRTRPTGALAPKSSAVTSASAIRPTQPPWSDYENWGWPERPIRSFDGRY